MSDPRFNSIHLDANSRRDDFRRARARLYGSCGTHTIALDRERLREEGDGQPHTIIQNLGDIPTDLQFWLVDKDGTYPLKGGLNSVGRMPDNDVVIADASVSRRHCAILVHVSRGCELHDTASKNGTFLNGTRISGPTRLVCGDEIKMCDHTIIFQSSQAEGENANSPSQLVTIG
jgi:hypothetical protein